MPVSDHLSLSRQWPEFLADSRGTDLIIIQNIQLLVKLFRPQQFHLVFNNYEKTIYFYFNLNFIR